MYGWSAKETLNTTNNHLVTCYKLIDAYLCGFIFSPDLNKQVNAGAFSQRLQNISYYVLTYFGNSVLLMLFMIYD